MAVFRIIQGRVIPENDVPRREAARAQARDARGAEASGLEGASAEGPVEFLPVGKGLPLTVMIRHVYTGAHPEPGFFGGPGDVAVVSGVRDFDVFSASARALNFVHQSVLPRSHLPVPSAFTQGTPVVSYSPAVLADSVTLTVELAVAKFPQEFVNSLSSAFSALSGIPLLMPFAGWLIGAGQITKLAGDLGHALMDGPIFSITEALNFDLPGAAPVTADFRVLASHRLRADLFRYKEGKGLVDLDDRRYAGEEPYVVISLDGRKNDRLAKFAPTVASAAILQRFFQVNDGQQATIDVLIDGLRLASDMKYRRQADELILEIAASGGDAERRKRLQDELKAVRDNILTAALKPSVP